MAVQERAVTSYEAVAGAVIAIPVGLGVGFVLSTVVGWFR